MHKAIIESRMHGAYSGLKKSPACDWLNDLLKRLDARGLNQLVHSFVAQMGQQDKVGGLLVEVELADQLIAVQQAANVTSDRQDGTAQVPCDITFEYQEMRADFQCKAVLNAFNEMWIAEFMAWVERSFSTRSPGLLLEFASVIDLNEADFLAFKQWFGANQASFVVDGTVEWCPSGASKGVRLEFMPRSRPGIARGVTWVASSDYSDVVHVSSDELRDLLWKRIKAARRSFGFMPGPDQFNFAVVDISSNAMYDEEDCYQALYGVHKWGIDPNKMEAGYAGHDGSGIFWVQKPDWVSGVIFPKRLNLNSFDYAVFPHPDHVKAVEAHWTSAPFRFGKALIE